MKEFEEAMKAGMDDLIDSIESTMDICGCTFEEAFPCESYKIFEKDGITYRAIIEVKLFKAKSK